MILAGDIGGTKTRIALFARNGNGLHRQQTNTYASADYAGIEAILADFIQESQSVGAVESTCIGVAGPVAQGVVNSTNLPWIVSERSIQHVVESPNVRLVNDLVATVSAVPHLSPADLLTIKPGESYTEYPLVKGVLAPGTGLGQGYIATVAENQHVPFGSEGGHLDFGPNNELEFDLYRYLHKKFGHVSYERIVSGLGLPNVYEFLAESGREKRDPHVDAQAQADKAATISRRGLEQQSQICDAALEIFVRCMGAQAGNMVLAMMARGGIYLGGGIPPKILPRILDGPFIESFLDKGRLRNVLESVPVYMIKDDHAALLGAASLAG